MLDALILSIDMKTKVVQHVPRILFNVFKVFKLSSFQVPSACQKLEPRWALLPNCASLPATAVRVLIEFDPVARKASFV